MNTEELKRELRAERPQAETEFTSRLDDWAASGFPHDSGLGPRALGAGAVAGSGRFGRWWQRLTDLSPRQAMLPLGAAATLLIVVGVAVSQSGDAGRDEIGPVSGQSLESSGGGDSAGSAAEEDLAAPVP